MTEEASAAPEMAAGEERAERSGRVRKPGAEPELRTDLDSDLVSGFFFSLK